MQFSIDLILKIGMSPLNHLICLLKAQLIY